jgi:serine phosphatase RsbU (regulator of sigma subunit)
MVEELETNESYSNKLAEELRLAYQALLNNVLISNKLLSQETEEDDILSLLLSITRLIIDYESGAVFRLESGIYKQVSGMDINEKFEKIRNTYLSEGIYEWATTQKRTLVMPEGENNTHILVPIITEKTDIGILDLQVPFDAGLIRNQDLDLLWVVVSNASSRCEQIKLNRWSGLVDVLLSTLEKVNSSEQLDMLFDSILKGLDQLLHCNRYLLAIKEDSELAIKARYDDGSSYCIPKTFKDSKTCQFIQKAIDQQKSIRIPSFNDSDDCLNCPHLELRPDFDSYLMIVPLVINGESYGAISILDYTYNSKLFTDDSQHIAELFANQVTIAIYQAQLREELQLKNAKINKEIKMAGIVQQSLLPDVQEEYRIDHGAIIRMHYNSDKICITGFYLPCSTLGGDFYDVIKDHSNIKLAIADVSGHGLSSSLITALYKMALHKFITAKIDNTPSEICAFLNSDLCKFIKTGDYITSFLGYLNEETLQFTYSSAGHPYPMHYNSLNNEVEMLQANGLPLAMLENQVYPEKSIELSPGDKILFFTDGITEAVNKDLEMFKKERLIDALKIYAGVDSYKTLSGIFSKLIDYAGVTSFADDISMLLIEIKK